MKTKQKTVDKKCTCCNQHTKTFAVFQHEETTYCEKCFNTFYTILKDATDKKEVKNGKNK